MKIITYIRRWNKWRKYNLNSRTYKMLVLLGIIKSPTMLLTILPEENLHIEDILNEWEKEK